jgi:phage regulator Rha-like protein
MKSITSAPVEPQVPVIYALKKQKVVLDSELAALFGVSTKRFNEAVRRNTSKFPADFAFQLTEDDMAKLKLPMTGTGKRGQHRKYLPWVFTEHGTIMAANVLRSPRAVQMSIYVVRAFIRMREEIATNLTILRRLSEVDKKLLEHDATLREIVEALAPLLNARAIEEAEAAKPKRLIGFNRDNS